MHIAAVLLVTSMAGGPEWPRRSLAAMGVCEQAGECMLRMEDEYMKLREPEVQRIIVATGRWPLGRIVDDFCSVSANMSAACFAHCAPDEDSLYSVLGSVNELICTERRDDVKKAVECARDMDLFGQGEPFVKQCGSVEYLLHRQKELMLDDYRNGTELKYQADEMFGERGLAADWCRMASCYLDELEKASEEKCGERKHGELARDIVAMLWPKAVAALDRMHVGCLLPERCRRAP